MGFWKRKQEEWKPISRANLSGHDENFLRYWDKQAGLAWLEGKRPLVMSYEAHDRLKKIILQQGWSGENIVSRWAGVPVKVEFPIKNAKTADQEFLEKWVKIFRVARERNARRVELSVEETVRLQNLIPQHLTLREFAGLPVKIRHHIDLGANPIIEREEEMDLTNEIGLDADKEEEKSNPEACKDEGTKGSGFNEERVVVMVKDIDPRFCNKISLNVTGDYNSFKNAAICDRRAGHKGSCVHTEIPVSLIYQHKEEK